MGRCSHTARRKAGVPVGSWAAALTAVVALCCAPTTASAKRADVKADRATLTAYKQFLTTVDAQIPVSTKAADDYVASISAGCPNVLGPLTSATAVNFGAVTALGSEGGLDVGIAADVPNRAALANFGNKVSRLPWSSRRSKLVVKRYVAAADAIYGMQMSDLCADARALVASNGQTTPAGTTHALAAIASASKAASADSVAMQKLLDRFATKADVPLAMAIKKLANEVRAGQRILQEGDVPKLLTALGFHRGSRARMRATRRTFSAPRPERPATPARAAASGTAC